MTRFTALLVVLSASACIGADEPLELQLVVSRSLDVLQITASATNKSSSDTTFCGRWGFEVVYVPDAETAVRIARRDSIANTATYDRWEGVRAPLVFDIGGLNGAEHWVTLAPHAAYSDTLAFPLSADSYRDWPGTLEVRYRLDLCEPEKTLGDIIPPNGMGGALIARIPVPMGGV